ncbi:MAG: ATP-binding cassette domain-containing protein [Caldilineaceae bacterium]
MLSFWGHNGSGKSTLAKHLNGLLAPTVGNVLVKGWNTKESNHLRAIRSTVGMVFQTPDNQIVATIVEEDVAFGPENLGIPREEMLKRVDWSLEQVNMSEFRHRAPHLLSGGQKQRICIAGVLAMQPDVLVLDESTAMLDPMGRQEVLQVAQRLNREQGTTVVAITHFMQEAIAVVALRHRHGGGESTSKGHLNSSGKSTAYVSSTDIPPRHRNCPRPPRRFDFPADILAVEELVAVNLYPTLHIHFASPASYEIRAREAASKAATRNLQRADYYAPFGARLHARHTVAGARAA